MSKAELISPPTFKSASLSLRTRELALLQWTPRHPQQSPLIDQEESSFAGSRRACFSFSLQTKLFALHERKIVEHSNQSKRRHKIIAFNFLMTAERHSRGRVQKTKTKYSSTSWGVEYLFKVGLAYPSSIIFRVHPSPGNLVEKKERR